MATEKDLLNEGMAFFRDGELDKAAEIFRRFLKEFPHHDLADNACYNLAKIAMKRGNSQRALEWLDFLLDNYPASDAAYFAEDERVELLRSMGMGPTETDEERYFKGKQAMSRKEFAEAESVFLSLIRDFADSKFVDNAYYNLALICKARGDIEEVKRYVDTIMTLHPDSDAAVYAKDLLAG